MKRLLELLREHAKNITDFEKKKNVTVNKRRIQVTLKCKSYICEKRILKNFSKSKNYWKVRIIAITQVNIEVQYIVYVI